MLCEEGLEDEERTIMFANKHGGSNQLTSLRSLFRTPALMRPTSRAPVNRRCCESMEEAVQGLTSLRFLAEGSYQQAQGEDRDAAGFN